MTFDEIAKLMRDNIEMEKELDIVCPLNSVDPHTTGSIVDANDPVVVQLVTRSWYEFRYKFNKAGYNLYQIRPEGKFDSKKSKIILTKKNDCEFDKREIFISEEKGNMIILNYPGCHVFEPDTNMYDVFFAVGLDWYGMSREFFYGESKEEK